MDKKKLIVIGIAFIVIVILLILFFTRGNITNNVIVTEVVEYAENKEKSNFEKKIDNVTINAEIPKDWKYEELPRNAENDFYKYALKIYKNQNDKYAVLYFYQAPIGLCGTGRTTKEINLNDGNKATIGYDYDKEIWQDIIFEETEGYVVIINYGLDKEESEEVLEFIKTINIKGNFYSVTKEYEFVGKIIEAHDNFVIVKPEPNSREIKSSDKIMVNINRPTNGTNDFYVVGNKIRITYNGVIMESYPAQIKAIQVELVI